MLNNEIFSNLKNAEKAQEKINNQKSKRNTQFMVSSFINGQNNLKEKDKDKELLSIFKIYKNQFANINGNKLNGGFQDKNSLDNVNREENKNIVKNYEKSKEELLRNFSNKIKLSGIIKNNK